MGDETDEKDCRLLVLKNGYNKAIPPFTMDVKSRQLRPAEVNISTSLKTVIEISERSHIIELKFELNIEWYEYRAKYYNIKENSALNVLSVSEMRMLWMPYIIFENTDLNEAVSIEEVDSKTFITREGNFTRAGLENVDEAEIFEGAENKITLTQTYSKRFHCTYLLHSFPFDSQVCYIHMALDKFDRDTTKLVPDQLELLSPKELSQYYIRNSQLVYYYPGSHNDGIKMEIIFKRRLTNELMTTYLPSFFLLGICYATTYFKAFYFEANVTVNLTVMLVATTLFISVMEKLPPTSYVRLVDLWLISTQLVPFLLVVMTTSIELFQDQGAEINHHGFARKIAFKDENDYTKEDFRKKILRYLLFTEKKLIPIIFVSFGTIYWTYGCMLYFQ